MSRWIREIDWGAEDGVVAGAESLAFGVLIFVMGTLIAVNAWAVVDAKMAAGAAAREATRVVVESEPGQTVEAYRARARQVATATVAGYGKSGVAIDEVTVDSGVPLQRCGRVTVTVRLLVPTVRLPLVGYLGGDVAVTGNHSEIVDPLRSGLPAGGACEA